jgi:Ner family transcriptional regulator
MARSSNEKWDRFAIKAELGRRGMTLTGIALDAGLSESVCRQGLGGYNRKGAQAIADALGIALEELFPDNYNVGRHHRRKLTRNDRKDGSAKSASSADMRGYRA